MYPFALITDSTIDETAAYFSQNDIGCAPLAFTIDGRTIDAILQMAPARVVYIACDCASLARDAAILCDKGGYGLTRVRAFDMFPRTANVETAALLCSQ